MEKRSYARWADILKTMGHPTRIRIIETLLEGGTWVSAIGSALGLAQSTVSQHLSLLRAKGVVRQERCGAKVKYSIADRTVEAIIKAVKGELT